MWFNNLPGVTSFDYYVIITLSYKATWSTIGQFDVMLLFCKDINYYKTSEATLLGQMLLS